MVRLRLLRFSCSCFGSASTFEKSSESLAKEKDVVVYHRSCVDGSTDVFLWQVLMWNSGLPGISSPVLTHFSVWLMLSQNVASQVRTVFDDRCGFNRTRKC